MRNLKFLLFGILFGLILTKAEVISWWRIQEMFRFESIHMYGIIGLAIVVGAISTQLIKRYRLRTINGDEIRIAPKPMHKGVFIGGIAFGIGWAFTGACPGPLFALVGNGCWVIIISLVSALFGTWTYGYFQTKLPH